MGPPIYSEICECQNSVPISSVHLQKSCEACALIALASCLTEWREKARPDVQVCVCCPLCEVVESK